MIIKSIKLGKENIFYITHITSHEGRKTYYFLLSNYKSNLFYLILI